MPVWMPVCVPGASRSARTRFVASRVVPALIGSTIVSTAASAQRGGVEDYPPALDSVWVPEPTQIDAFVRDEDWAVALGKALFWDVQVGSDGQTACATCHGLAGVDPRTVNTVHPGFNGTFDGGVGPGGSKDPSFFPTTSFTDPASRFGGVVRSVDDIAGSQGVLRRLFQEMTGEPPVEVCEDRFDPVFNDDGQNVRQVTSRNPPSVINAVYNIRNFWDGRANPWFNGVDGAGPTNPDARVWRWDAASQSFSQVAVAIDFAGLASQAVGPVLNGVEMSCSGRSWHDVAIGLLGRRPLAEQRVASNDSVLGPLVADDGLGLDTTYRAMIVEAFRARWRRDEPTPAGIPQIEANMPLFFGLALQAYQTTLISEDTPYDRFIESGFPAGGGGHLDELALEGLDLFVNGGQFEDLPAANCIECHASPTFSAATWPGMGVTAAPVGGNPPSPAPNGIERMLSMGAANLSRAIFADHPADGDPAIQPLDFPLAGDIELVLLASGSDDPDDGEEVLDEEWPELDSGCDLVRRIAIDADESEGILSIEVRRDMLDKSHCGTWVRFELVDFPVGRYALLLDDEHVGTLEVVPDGAYDVGFYNLGVRPTEEDLGVGATTADGTPLSWTLRRQQGLPMPEVEDPSPVPPGATTAVHGAFKTPGLRNVALTGPYMHHGGMSTLRQVVEFYNRGGDFHEQNLENLSPEMVSLGLSEAQIDAIVAFLESLTDGRVADESAPFDHPELPLPNGETIPVVGAAGRAAECLPPLQRFDVRLSSDGLAGDCDGDGRLDDCMILRDPTLDADGNGVLDVCDDAAPPSDCGGDLDGNGRVDGTDLALILAFWGTDASLGDCDGSGSVDGIDLAIVLGHWTG
jgi:cytochrome c peroxidase